MGTKGESVISCEWENCRSSTNPEGHVPISTARRIFSLGGRMCCFGKDMERKGVARPSALRGAVGRGVLGGSWGVRRRLFSLLGIQRPESPSAYEAFTRKLRNDEGCGWRGWGMTYSLRFPPSLTDPQRFFVTSLSLSPIWDDKHHDHNRRLLQRNMMIF